MIIGLDGEKRQVRWDADAFCYLARVCWDPGAPLLVVQSRDQRRMRLLAVDPVTSATTVLREDTDSCWLDLVPGVPARLADGRIAWTADDGGAKRLLVASEHDLAAGTAEPLTPPSLQVRAVLSVDGDTVLLSGSDGEPTEVGVWAYGPGGLAQIAGHQAAGVHTAARKGGTTVLTSRSMAAPGLTVTVLRELPGSEGNGTTAGGSGG